MLSARGPWNDETLARGAKEFSSHSKCLEPNRAWAQLSCLYGESLMPPWTFSHFIHHTKIRKSQGLSALAVVILESDIEATIKQQLTQAYMEVDIQHRFFNNLEEGTAWLAQLGFELEQREVDSFFGD